jgi:hypothetical protein
MIKYLFIAVLLFPSFAFADASVSIGATVTFIPVSDWVEIKEVCDEKDVECVKIERDCTDGCYDEPKIIYDDSQNLIRVTGE